MINNKVHSLIVSILLGLSSHCLAMPENYTVQSGEMIINNSNNEMNIIQKTDNILIDWEKFSINANEKVNFIQPTNNSLAINRVIGPDASIIAGKLNATGNIMLINPNGITFNNGAEINVNSLIASTNDLTKDQYARLNMNNVSPLAQSENTIINDGIINAKDIVILTANKVVNNNTIKADNSITLGASYNLSLDTANKINISYSQDTVSKIVNNYGALKAGNNVLLTTKAANKLELIKDNKITQAGEPNNDLSCDKGLHQTQIGVGYDHYNSDKDHPSSWDDIANNSKDVYGYVQEVKLPYSKLTAVRQSETTVFEKPTEPTNEPVYIPEVKPTPIEPIEPIKPIIPEPTPTEPTDPIVPITPDVPDEKPVKPIKPVENNPSTETNNNVNKPNNELTNNKLIIDTMPQKLLITKNLDGTGNVSSAAKAFANDTMVLGLTEAVLPLYEITNNIKTFTGNYKIDAKPDMVDVLLAKNQQAPQPYAVTDTQYRELDTQLNINDTIINVKLTYDNQDLNIMPQINIENKENALSQSLLIAFNQMGLTIDDLNSVNFIYL